MSVIEMKINNLTVPAPDKIKELVSIECSSLDRQMLLLIDDTDIESGHVTKYLSKTKGWSLMYPRLYIWGERAELHFSETGRDKPDAIAERLDILFKRVLLDVDVSVAS